MHKSGSRIWVLCLLALAVAVASASFCVALTVGVEPGDCVSYNVEVTGTPPAGHDVIWAQLQVTDVDTTTIFLDVQTRFSNGSTLPDSIILDPAAGILGDGFVIPADLELGDSFFAVHLGDIIITDVEQQTFGGVERTVVISADEQNQYRWDQKTGFLVGAYSDFGDWTINTTLDETNLWSPQVLGLSYTTFIILLVCIAIVVVVVVALVLRRLRH
ncbi:MAG: hypothetical protein NWF04_03155 [Candidatus Bathyarchaeota archaeon]|nr:hypothetical protein [Candidatus Bathyarchaeota archaeon]